MDDMPHGGECCGITHAFSFYGTATTVEEDLDKVLESFLDNYYDNGNQLEGYEAYEKDDGWECECVKSHPLKKFSCILEVTLTDGQMVQYSLILKKKGFKIVNRFLNSNSGNVVNVLHYNPAGRRKLPPAPYKW